MATKRIKAADVRANKKVVNDISDAELREIEEKQDWENTQHHREVEDREMQLDREAEDREIDEERQLEDEGLAVVDFVRVQARVSSKNFEFLKKEANRTGTNISAIASIYIADGVEAAKKREKANIERK